MCDKMTDNDGDVRRAAILDAAGAVFFERGYDATSTLEIARRAKTSKRALYELFSSKEGILAALIRAASCRMQAPLALPAPGTEDELLGLLAAFGGRFLAQLLDPDRTEMYRLAIGEARRSGQVARELELNGRKPVTDSMRTVLEAAAGAGIIRGDDIELVVAVYFGVLIGGSQVQCLLGENGARTPSAIDAKVALAIEAVRRIIR
jgi:AcrR family transcriptional regulator